MNNEFYTHQVINQPQALADYNSYLSDVALQQLCAQYDAQWGEESLIELGELLGRTDWINKGTVVNQITPEFYSHDAYGRRIDEVRYHPAYHDLMALACQFDIPSLPWKETQNGSHVVRMARNYLYNQNEAGSACPLTMTFACVPSINHNKALAKHWMPKLLNSEYDDRNLPLADKKAATVGMAMTEKQGGTDVRANTSQAKHIGSDELGERYQLTGHKWFCSAPMSDAFLTLAQTESGLSCFLMPRWRYDGEKNNIHIQRLKDKMGNRSNASSEIEFAGAEAHLIGEPGKGVRTIIEMVAMTRYDCMIGSSALMRQATVQVLHHITHRKVFGELLIDQPLMQNVVADLCLESVAALALTARVAHALDRQELQHERNLVRLLTAVGKYWICKRASMHIGEAQECLGGIGYVEELPLARLYREAPVNSIWEGSGNVQCLDVIRAIHKSPDCYQSFIKELEQARGGQPLFDQALDELKGLSTDDLTQVSARHWVEKMAKTMQAAQLILMNNNLISDAYCEARLAPSSGLCFGQLPDSHDFKAILNRSFTID